MSLIRDSELLAYLPLDIVYRVSELETKFLTLLMCVVSINVLHHIIIVDREEGLGVLQVHVKLVLENLVRFSVFCIFLVNLVDLDLHVVGDQRCLLEVTTDLALSVDEHVGVCRRSTKHGLKRSRHDRRHSAVIEVIPVLGELNVGVRYREVAEPVIKVLLLFLLLLLVFVLILLEFLLSLLLVLLCLQFLGHHLALLLAELIPVYVLRFEFLLGSLFLFFFLLLFFLFFRLFFFLGLFLARFGLDINWFLRENVRYLQIPIAFVKVVPDVGMVVSPIWPTSMNDDSLQLIGAQLCVLLQRSTFLCVLNVL